MVCGLIAGLRTISDKKKKAGSAWWYYSYWNLEAGIRFSDGFFTDAGRVFLMNTIMIAVNVLVFLLTEITGSSLDSRHLINLGSCVYTLHRTRA